MTDIKIDLKSFVPIFEQIKQQVTLLILRGRYKQGDALPSIRDLAAGLIVNPNTVARAYRELEQTGVITTRRGKGCFVSEDALTLLPASQTGMARDIVCRAVDELLDIQLDGVRIRELIDEILDDKCKKKEKVNDGNHS
jgi:GntR family transcriptional regulator